MNLTLQRNLKIFIQHIAVIKIFIHNVLYIRCVSYVVGLTLNENVYIMITIFNCNRSQNAKRQKTKVKFQKSKIKD